MKPRKVFVEEAAATDIELARSFYELQNPGLGDYFVAGIISDLESLVFFGGIHPKWHGFHRMLAKRFPFAIYYELADDAVTVMAVLDMRRDPSAIRRRLDND